MGMGLQETPGLDWNLIAAAMHQLTAECHQASRDKGWWDKERNVPEILALMHSEISEALEDYRNCRPLNATLMACETLGKPEGFPVELADLTIRMLDLCGRWNINLVEAIKMKLAYNRTRPTRHGGKLA